MRIVYSSNIGKDQFKTIEQAREYAIKKMKVMDRKVCSISSIDLNDPTPYMTVKTEGIIERAGDSFLWEIKKNKPIGTLDAKGVLHKGVKVKKDRYYSIGVAISPTGSFIGNNKKFKTLSDARKHAYKEIKTNLDSKGFPNYGLTTTVMIYGYNIRSGDRASFEEYVFPMKNGTICTAKITDFGQDIPYKIYSLNPGGTTREYIMNRSYRQIHTMNWGKKNY